MESGSTSRLPPSSPGRYLVRRVSTGEVVLSDVSLGDAWKRANRSLEDRYDYRIEWFVKEGS